MKRKFLILAIIFCCTFIKANSQDITKIYPQSVRIGCGFSNYKVATFEFHSSCYGCNDYRNQDMYDGNLIGTPAINASFFYNIKSWLSFGFNFTYIGAFQNTYYSFNDKIYSKNTFTFLGVVPTIRFEWVRAENVRLYSSAGLGIGHASERSKNILTNGIFRDGDYYPIVDFNPFGITVGRRFFGFFEVGMSTIGFCKGGIGYRF